MNVSSADTCYRTSKKVIVSRHLGPDVINFLTQSNPDLQVKQYLSISILSNSIACYMARGSTLRQGMATQKCTRRSGVNRTPHRQGQRTSN